jgi:hypothetical protein
MLKHLHKTMPIGSTFKIKPFHSPNTTSLWKQLDYEENNPTHTPTPTPTHSLPSPFSFTLLQHALNHEHTPENQKHTFRAQHLHQRTLTKKL